MQSYSHEKLVQTIMNTQYASHNAVEDVKSLQDLVNYCNIDDAVLLSFSESMAYTFALYEHAKMTDSNMLSLQSMVADKIISQCMAKKIASSNLCMEHLKLAMSRDSLTGLANLFKEPLSNAKPRVKSTKHIISKVFQYLSSSS